MVEIGKLTSSVGLRGEMRVTLYNSDSPNFHVGAEVTLKTREGEHVHMVESVSDRNGTLIARLSGIDNRNASDMMRGAEILIPDDAMAELPEGEHYARDLIGLEVFDRASGRVIGKVKDILDNTAQDLYCVTDDDGREILIPGVDAFIKKIDTDAGRIDVELIPGFLD